MDVLMLIGQNVEVVRNMAKGFGVEAARIRCVGWSTPERVFEEALAITEHESTIVAIGNMGGMGGQVADYFENRSLNNHDRIGDHAGIGSQPALV